MLEIARDKIKEIRVREVLNPYRSIEMVTIGTYIPLKMRDAMKQARMELSRTLRLALYLCLEYGLIKIPGIDDIREFFDGEKKYEDRESP